jgi:cell fate (sporulation/competence/biofilm development) regulator YlbF (YheA/YmcA/DUF963 family)
MTRKIEKKEWRTIVDSVLETQNNLKSCITSSDEFAKLSKENQDILTEGTDNSLLKNYLKSYRGKKSHFSESNLAVHNTESQFWVDNYNNLSKVHDKCNLFSFFEAMENKFNLINLKGHYDTKY